MSEKEKKDALLTVQNISFGYPNQELIFENINFQLKKGEIISLVGLSGAGKSTLLKCIAGIYSLKSGEVFLENEKLPDPKDLLTPGHPEIALVNQEFELEDYFTVRENISNHLHHLPLEERKNFTEELISVFQLDEVADLKSKEISGGEKQRLSMACALAKEPQCLLLDEPFVHLDVHLHRQITEYIQTLVQKRKMGIILVTHNGIEALEWSDQIIMMKNGRISSKHTPETAYFKPKNLHEGRFFGELNSIYKNGKQILFRPTEFSLNSKNKNKEIKVKWQNSQFRGAYFAHYFKLESGKKIVLFSPDKMNKVSKIYV